MYLMLDGRPVYASSPIPVHARVAAGGTSLRIYAGNGDPFDIDVFTADGKRERIVRRTDPPIPVSAEMHKRYKRNWVGDDRYGFHAQRRRVEDAMPLQTHFPAYAWLYVDTEGCLWVDSLGDGFHVFDPQGVWLGPVPLPGQPLEIGRDYVLLLQRDSLQVERVKLYGLKRN